MQLVPSTQRNRPTDNRNKREPGYRSVHPGTATGHTTRPSTVSGRSGAAGTGIQNLSLDEPCGIPTRAGSPDLDSRIRRPTVSNPRRNSSRSRPNPGQLASGPHHCPTRQDGAPLCTLRNMPTDQRVSGRSPPGIDNRARRRQIHPCARHLPREQGGGKEETPTRTDNNPGNETSSPTLDPIQTTGPCPHPSRAQYPAVHRCHVRGAHATRLDQVRNRDPGETHGATGYHGQYTMGQRSARRRNWGAGYDCTNPVRRTFEARSPVRGRL